MKKLYFFLLLIIGVTSFGQKISARPIVKVTCLTDELMNAALKNTPELKKRMELMNDGINQSIISNKANKAAASMLTIPVVFFVVHNNNALGTGSNINDVQVNSQLDALNTYFNPYNIKFCLATKNGTQTITSINHVNGGNQTNHIASDSGQQQLINIAGGNLSQNNFLRIWIVNSINGSNSGILGYSMFPGGSNVFDGIVMKYDATGDITTCASCNLLPNYNLGKVLVHEVGHYLGLYHTFQGGCAGLNTTTCSTEGDYVCDTPPVQAPNFGCTVVNTCNETNDLPDAINNHMDYTDDTCRNTFTTGQKDRMFAALSNYRSELTSTDNLIYTGTCGSASLLSATFTPSAYQTCYNSSISFTPLSTGTGLTYLWDFGDVASGVSNTSNLQNPLHVYTNTSISNYAITLTISNGVENFTFSTTIFVSNCTLLNNSDSNWRFGNGNGISFNTGVPVTSTISPDFSYRENSACISNTSGQLLFKACGTAVLNDNFTFVNDNLMGSTSSHRGTLIVPNPNPSLPNQYYLFTTNAIEQTPRSGMRYSIVDALNSSMISISPTNLNLPLTVSGNNGYIITSNGGIECGEGSVRGGREGRV